MKNPKQKIDRRVRRTRRMFREAILSLIMEKEFDSLTITEITERAGLRRATFYLHYETKEDLLMSALEDTFDELVEQSQNMNQGDYIAGKSRPDAYQVTFDHVAENAALYQRLLIGRGDALVTQRIRAYLARLVMDSLDNLIKPDLTMPKDVIAYFIAGSELSLIIWWLEADMPYSTDRMAQMAHQLVLQGVYGVLGDAVFNETQQ